MLGSKRKWLFFSSDPHVPRELETLVARRRDLVWKLDGGRPARSGPVSSWDIQASIVDRR